MFTTIITFCLVLGFLVFVHELGHFVAAKFFKVRVDEFSIGFPPRIFSVKKGETRYALNWIPLGGYVTIKGEGGEFKDEPDSFSSKPLWQRSIILSAGVIMNFFTAFVLITFGFMIGIPVSLDDSIGIPDKANIRDVNIQVLQVTPDSPAEIANIKMGDIILSIDGQKFSKTEELQKFIDTKQGSVASLEIRREGDIMKIDSGTYIIEDTNKYGVGVALVQSGIVSYPPHIAVIESGKRTVAITGQIFSALGGLLKKFVTREKIGVPVSGPIGIAVLTGEVSRLGFIYLLQFMALLSINLAIINILPFPALDGARIFLLGIEKLRGKAMNEKVEGVIHTFGFSFLMLLMVVVTYKDVTRHGGKMLDAITSLFS